MPNNGETTALNFRELSGINLELSRVDDCVRQSFTSHYLVYLNLLVVFELPQIF